MAKSEIAEAFTREDDETAEEFAARSTDDDELLVKATNMNIKRYVPVDKPGIYDDQVQTLIAVDQETGYQNAIEVLVPADQVKKHKRFFSVSARRFEKTARIVNGEEGVPQGDGGTLLEFVLVDKVHRKTKQEIAAASSAEAVE